MEGIRIWAAPDSVRVVFDLKKKPEFTYFSLSSPTRLVIDMKNTQSKVNLSNVENQSKLIKKIRISRPSTSRDYRVVFELNESVPPSLFALEPTKPYGHRLVVDLKKQKVTKIKKVAPSPSTMRDIIIAIDAGHGGEDSGAIGRRGTKEKRIVLSVAKKLKTLIDKVPGMTARMIRTGDYYVDLNQRSLKARQMKADLLLSIHADSFFKSTPRGASVWVLSTRRANSEIGRWLEKEEKHSDLLGGAGQIINTSDNEKYLVRTLLDMSMDHSRAMSFAIASDVSDELSKVTLMHKRKPASASLAVLKSPDIPSILIETGFISNRKEERLLRTSAYQWKLAKAIKEGVYKYYQQHPLPNTFFAQLSDEKHKVKLGESLSIIAKRYGVPLKKLKQMNGLKSNTIQVGQVLVIPRV